MSRDTFIFIAFCVFLVLAGFRVKQRISGWKQQRQTGVAGKKETKTGATEEPPEVKEKRVRREKRVRFFTIAQLVVLAGLMVYMIPALVQDFMYPGRVDSMNLILRCLIFVFTIYIFILAYLKIFAKKQTETNGNKK